MISVLTGAMSAQTRVSAIDGTVTDPSGAVVPDAQVEVSSSGFKMAVKTDRSGRYTVNGLQPGAYRLTVSAPGFAGYRAGVEVASGSRTVQDAHLEVAGTSQAVTVADTNRQLDMESSNNAGALVMKEGDLASLSDDPDDLAQDLQALAGPSAGPNGAEIYIDGFSGGKLPPKSSIREIRVNQNPFSAEYDRLGYGRVEVLTKPGTDRFRGEMLFNFGDGMFNARNPFAPNKPDYQRRMLEGNVGGPLTGRSSFFIELERRDMQETSVINALVLDSSFAVTPYQQALLTPTTNTEANTRLDYQLTSNNTLVGRYDWETRAQNNSGLDTFSLPARSLNRDTRDHVLQITDTAILNASMIHEVRFQYARTGTTSLPGSSDPAIQVLEAFSGGGSTTGFANVCDNRWELTDLVSISRSRHVVKFGGRLRGVTRRDESTQNFNGLFTFTSLNAYRATLQGIRDGLKAQAIRELGGGASQFSISAGEPAAEVKQYDAGVFVQDDWRIRPQFTLTLGLRYEIQTNIGDHRSFAPRVGFAWAPGAGRPKGPLAIVRAGFGMFYDRVSESLTLDALRFNGQRQLQYVVSNPDFYPTIPSLASLAGNVREQSIRMVDSGLRSPYVMQTALSIERQLPKGITTSLTYMTSRGVHMLRSRNINAPLPGTYLPDQPSSGLRMYPGGNINLYESTGFFRQSQLIVNVNARVNRRISTFGYYTLGKANSDTDGSSSFPANQFDLTSDYGRAGFDVRHRAFIGGSLTVPYGVMLSPFIVVSSGPPFNITTGQDLNGDSLYNDRPALATDLTRASVVRTSYGLFDTNPLPGQPVIARNLGNSPGMFAVNLRLSKAFRFGGESKGNTSNAPSSAPPPPGPGGPGGPGGGGPHGPGGGGHGPGHDSGSGGSGGYTLTFGISARNLLNTVNLAAPVGNLTSSLFGQSVALGGFGHRGGGTSANRSVELQVRFSF